MKDLIKNFVGKEGQIVINGLTINVTIIDVKNSYGNIRYGVSPVSGSGFIWIESITVND